ncbi:DUF1360 domain-containing protein [Nocardioides sp. LHG3406-4]|uniref:DUF1360 domain-containing protein n=1 Tax=Nocardioides sp. LHG3406-4 TaxID=2804575 RepID=UPI003CF70C78
MSVVTEGVSAFHLEHAGSAVARIARSYDPQGQVNLAGFAGSLATYAATVGVLVAASRTAGRGLPERYTVADVVLGGLATHKFTRLLSKASVTSPLRAPFTRFERPAGSAEHDEAARGSHGARHTVGELLTCPFCLAVWVGTGYVASLALAPRPARTWAAVFAVTAVSDSLQHLYARLRDD